MSDGCMARTQRAPSRAQILRGNASRPAIPSGRAGSNPGESWARPMPLSARRHRARDRHVRLEARRHDGAGLAARLDIALGRQQRIGRLDGASRQAQFLGQRARRGNAVARLQHAAGDGAAKAIVDLPVEGVGRRWIQRRDLAGLGSGHGSSPPRMGRGDHATIMAQLAMSIHGSWDWAMTAVGHCRRRQSPAQRSRSWK